MGRREMHTIEECDRRKDERSAEAHFGQRPQGLLAEKVVQRGAGMYVDPSRLVALMRYHAHVARREIGCDI